MGWGNTLKVNVKYRGKVLTTKEQLQKEYDKVENELKKKWEVVKQMFYTSPIDYVSQYGEDCWRTYDRTIQTLTLRLESAINDIKRLTKLSCALDMLIDTQNTFNKKQKEEYALRMYGCNKFSRWYYELTENLECNKDFGTIGTCYPYFSKPRIALTSVWAIEGLHSDLTDSVDLWFNKIKHYALINIKDMYCADCDAEEDNVCHSITDVMFVLDDEWNGIKECLDEDLTQMYRLELALESKDSVEEYIKYIEELKAKEQEWADKKNALMNKAFDLCGVDRLKVYSLPNYQELMETVDSMFKELMQENGIPLENPINWDDEDYEE